MLELQPTAFIFPDGYSLDSCSKNRQGLQSNIASLYDALHLLFIATLNLTSLHICHSVIEHLQSPYGAVQFIKHTGAGGVISRAMCPNRSLLHCSFLCLGAAGTRTAPYIPQQARKKKKLAVKGIAVDLKSL